MSTAGKTRLSASLRSSWISALPVPLNSSKITSSMRLPVSTKAVGDDREAAALFDIPRSAEEALGPLQGVGVDAAGEDFATRRNHRIVARASRVMLSAG